MSINKILFLFLGVMTLSIFGLWQFAHTEKFADFLSSKLKATFFKNFNGEMTFKSIEISILPLSTKIKKFSLKIRNGDGKNTYCNFDEVGFYFSPVDLLSSKIIISQAVVEGGFVRNESKDGSPKPSSDDLRIEKFFSYYKETRIGKALQRIKSIRVKNANLDNFIDIDDVTIQTYRNYIVLKGGLGEVVVGNLYKDLERSYKNIQINLEVEQKGVRVKSLEMRDELEVVSFSGGVRELEQGHEIEGSLGYQGRLKKIFDLIKINFPRREKFSGYVDGKIKISGDIKKPVFNIDFKGERVESPYFFIDEIHGKFDVVSDKIVIKQVDLKRRGGEARLLNSIEIFNTKSNQIISGAVELEVNDFFSKEAFRAFKFLDIVKGKINGVVGLEWTKSNVVIKPVNGLYFEKFRINARKEEKPILKNDRMTFNRGRIVVGYNGGVRAEVDISFPSCRFRGRGVIDEDGIDFLVDNSTVDFFKLGEVAGVQIYGNGDFKMHIVGPLEDVWFNFDLDLNDFEISGYKFKNIDGAVSLSLENRALYFKNIKSAQKISRLKADGELYFKDKTLLNLNIIGDRISLNESYFSAGPIFNPIKQKFKNVKARYSGNVSVKADFDSDRVESRGEIYTDEISFYVNEYVDVLSTKFSYKDKKMVFDNIEVKKGNGSLKGRLEIDTKKDFFKYQAKLSNLDIGDIYFYRLSNLQYKGKIFGESVGKGRLSRYIIKANLDMLNGYIGKRKVSNGKVIIHASQDSLKLDGNFLGDIINFESNVNWGQKKSYFRGEVNASDVRTLMGLVSRRNISNKAIRGGVEIFWNASFYIMPLKIVNLDFVVKKFAFKYDQLTLDLVEGKDRIVVKNSEIENWGYRNSWEKQLHNFCGKRKFIKKF